MEFKEVIQICLDFAIANEGTIQSYPENAPDMLAVHSRTTSTEILVARGAEKAVGEWQISLLKNSCDKVTISTEEQLMACLGRFWRAGGAVGTVWTSNTAVVCGVAAAVASTD